MTMAERVTMAALARDIGRVETSLEVHLAECALLRRVQVEQHEALSRTVDAIASAVGADKEQRSRRAWALAGGLAKWGLPLLLTAFLWMALRIWPPTTPTPAAAAVTIQSAR